MYVLNRMSGLIEIYCPDKVLLRIVTVRKQDGVTTMHYRALPHYCPAYVPWLLVRFASLVRAYRMQGLADAEIAW